MRKILWMVLVLTAACQGAPEQKPGPEKPKETAKIPPAPEKAPPAPEPEPERYGPTPFTATRAQKVLFLEKSPPEAADCPQKPTKDAIECLIALRFEADKRAAASAQAFFESTGSVAGVEEPHTMNGGYRGMIEIVPEVPERKYRKHLDWVKVAHEDFDRFFADLQTRSVKTVDRYAWAPLEYRFYRSVGRTTPSAYAADWVVAYNVSGSLHRSANAVRNTLFHEIFHLNDQAHGQWSRKALDPIRERIFSKCPPKRGKPNTACFRTFAPHGTMVRGGTFYAFQPGNGVGEYAAELAIRYYEEHRTILAGRKPRNKPFKCGHAINAEAWTLMVDEFFAGIDLTKPCK